MSFISLIIITIPFYAFIDLFCLINLNKQPTFLKIPPLYYQTAPEVIKMDKQKADQIITEYMQKLYGFAIKKTYSYDEAEELCAEIIKEVYSSLLKAREVINVEGYIWRISEHTYAKYVSFQKKHEGISIDGMEIPFYDDYVLEDSDEELGRLRREIAFLTEKRRRIDFRFYYEDKSISVIAKEMGIPVGTVKWHLNKARNELKEGFSMGKKLENWDYRR